MAVANATNSYRRVAAQTAPPGQLVLMLYEGTIRFLERSLTGFGMEDPAESNETINNNVVRAQEIIRELARCLDLGVGGELARHLERLYDYFDRRLMESNLKKEEAGIRDVLDRMSTLRNSWAAVLRGESRGPEDQFVSADASGFNAREYQRSA